MAPCAKCVNISSPTGVSELRVTYPLRYLLLILLPGTTALAASTQVSTTKPIINFSLPSFTAEGFRTWLVRGSEAQYVDADRIDVKGLTLSIFSGKADGKVDTLILSPTATVMPADTVVTGTDTIRVINDEFEATGSEWRYVHKERKVTIEKNVRISFRAEFKDILK